MSAKIYKRDEQIKLIMECRQSGLSDYQWCEQKGIKPGTFYNWVSKLRKSGYTFPDSETGNIQTTVSQEVVKVNLLKSENAISALEQNASPLPIIHTSGIAAELMLGNISLRLYNGADPELIGNTIQCVGGVCRAW